MAGLFYALCSLTALVCAVFLLRGYTRSGYRLLLWSGICFVGLTLNNLMVILDKIILPEVDLVPLRLVIGLVAMLFLLYGMIWDSK